MDQRLNDSFVDLERHRVRLRGNVSKLQQSLQTWRLWDAEYEELKEELMRLDDEPGKEQILALAKEVEGKVLKQKEVVEIFGLDRGMAKKTRQVTDLLVKRIEYVEKNIESLTKQISTLEDRILAIEVVKQPEVRSDEGLPIMEITEELDEDGNMISGTVSRPGDSAPQIAEVLKKAGIANPETEAADKVPPNGRSEAASITQTARSDAFEAESAKKTDAIAAPDGETKTANASNVKKKSVSFSSDTHPEAEKESRPAQVSGARTATSTARYGHAAEDVDMSGSIMPDNESPEDAAFRAEILEYVRKSQDVQNRSVVAELSLEEDEEEWEDEGDIDSDDEAEAAVGTDDSEDEDEDEDEDEWGRSRRRVLTGEYTEQMRALEKRLLLFNSQMGGASLPEGAAQACEGDSHSPEMGGGEGEAEEGGIQHNLHNSRDGMQDNKKKKKGRNVRFAEELDIAPSSTLSRASLAGAGDDSASASASGSVALTRPNENQTTATMSEAIVEREVFARRGEEEQQEEQEVVERQLLDSAVAGQYYAMRNRRVKQQGGFEFGRDEEEEEEGEDQGQVQQQQDRPRVSRFKAARLGRR